MSDAARNHHECRRSDLRAQRLVAHGAQSRGLLTHRCFNPRLCLNLVCRAQPCVAVTQNFCSCVPLPNASFPLHEECFATYKNIVCCLFVCRLFAFFLVQARPTLTGSSRTWGCRATSRSFASFVARSRPCDPIWPRKYVVALFVVGSLTSLPH